MALILAYFPFTGVSGLLNRYTVVVDIDNFRDLNEHIIKT